MAFKFAQRQVADPAAQQNFEQLSDGRVPSLYRSKVFANESIFDLGAIDGDGIMGLEVFWDGYAQSTPNATNTLLYFCCNGLTQYTGFTTAHRGYWNGGPASDVVQLHGSGAVASTTMPGLTLGTCDFVGAVGETQHMSGRAWIPTRRGNPGERYRAIQSNYTNYEYSTAFRLLGSLQTVWIDSSTIINSGRIVFATSGGGTQGFSGTVTVKSVS